MGVWTLVAETGDDSAELQTGRTDHVQSAELATELDELESLPRFDPESAGRRAERAEAAARELGDTELELRARLVRADVLERAGNVAEAGRIAQDVHRWATDHDSVYLLAHSHYVLQAVFQDLGDSSLALEHAVRAVDLLGENGPPPLRVDHLVRLADCLAINRDHEAARERYPEVLRLAEELGDVDRQLVVLNNQAYFEALAGEYETALIFSGRMQALSRKHGISLHVGRLDTIARALMGLGRLDEAEAVLQPGLGPADKRLTPDGDGGADYLLTLSEIQRRRGRLDQAQGNLDEAIRVSEQHGLTAIRVRARREQAELHAASGDFQAAFEEHKRYSEAVMQLQSAQRDARALTLQAMYETTQARKQSRRYRELSLRDPLTGLYNRRYVDEELPRLLGRDADPTEVVAVALLDLDKFKAVNDTCSHEIGDEVLRVVARLLEERVAAGDPGDRGGSFAARMGGEEFLLVLLAEDAAVTAVRLQDVCVAIRNHPWHELTGTVPVTASIGSTATSGPDKPTSAQMLSRADANLYRAKRQGRDQVISDSS